MANKLHTFAGKIAKTSPYGFMFMQHADKDKWVNYGKYFEGEKLETGDHGLEYTAEVTETPSGGYYLKNINKGIHGEDSVTGDDVPAKNEIKPNGSVAPVNSKKAIEYRADTQLLIIRQSVLSSACILFKNQKIGADQVLETAELFESWVTREEDKNIDDVPF